MEANMAVMQWRWFYMIILLCSVAGFVACQEEENGSGTNFEPPDQEEGDNETETETGTSNITSTSAKTNSSNIANKTLQGRSFAQSNCPYNTCDQDGGECVRYDSVQVFECKCRNGYTGKRCDVAPVGRNVHPCVPNPCANSGTCRVAPGSGDFACFCMQGYSGKTCTQRSGGGGFNPNPIIPGTNLCVPNPCPQLGRCTAMPGLNRYLCEAPDRPLLPQPLLPVQPIGNPCVPNRCQNGATCNVVPGGGGFKCFCLGGYTGTYCEHLLRNIGGGGVIRTGINPCVPNQCRNGATCNVKPGGVGFKCFCLGPFTGTYCEQPLGGGVIRTNTNPCVPNQCRNGATCNVRPGGVGFKCFCLGPFTGTYCEQPLGGGVIRTNTNPCVPNQCRNGATCNVRPGGVGFKCFCLGPYTGTYCEQPLGGGGGVIRTNPCVPNQCRNGATCNVRPGGVGFKCFCTSTYTGDYCEQRTVTNPCVPSPCNNGRCSVVSATARCDCYAGWTGTYCNIRPRNPCMPNPCLNYGRCNPDPQRTFVCFCEGGYTGTRCEVAPVNPCVPNPCLNGATCNNNGGVALCHCETGYSGTRCESAPNPCVPNPCRNRGTCNVNGNTFYCFCLSGYGGEYCDPIPRNPCSPNPCRNGGSCNVNGQSFYCFCLAGFGGQYCDPVPKNPCVPNPCRNGGTCNVNGQSFYCSCLPGFGGQYCDPIPKNPCVPNPCRNGGTCNVNGQNFYCSCLPGFGGQYCNPIPKNPCVPNPCRNGGTCNVNGQSFYCFCLAGFGGEYCDPIPKNPCVPNPCRNGGTCNVNGQTFYCACLTGYGGQYCDPIPKNPCIPSPCRNGGTCQVNGNSFVCLCRSGYGGNYCDPIPRNPCIPNPCQNSGTCNVNGLTFFCYCVTGWQGTTCTVKTPKQNDPCTPSPCKGGCLCKPSCRHSDGYYCQSTNGLLGKNCGIPAPVVNCGNNAITVSINAAIVAQYDGGIGGYKMFMSPSHAMNPAPTCPATVQNGQYIFTLPLPFTGCGSRVTPAANGKTQVSNYIWINRLIGNGLADMPVPIIHFICNYEKQYSIVTSMRPSIDTPPTIISKGSRTNTANIELCKSGSACPNKCPVQFSLTNGAIYTVGQKIHLLFTPAQQGATFRLQDLLLSCSSAATNPATAPVNLITAGCLPIGSNKYLPTTARLFSTAVCVSFPVPMIAGCQQFYIHANLQACTASACITAYGQCSTQGRRKRSEETSLEETSKIEIFGPIFVIDGKSGIATEIMYPGEEYVNSTATGVLILKNDIPDAGATSDTAGLPLHIALGVLLFMAVIIFSVLVAHNWHYINAHCGRKF
ncbi:uncharacterized protein LOC120332574 isoform X1 [Styela clava]